MFLLVPGYQLTQFVPDKIHRAVKWLSLCVHSYNHIQVRSVWIQQNSYPAHTHNLRSVLLQPFYSFLDLVWDNLGKPVPKETFTNLHLSWSSIISYLLPPSCMIHGIFPVQFTCLTVFSIISLQVFFGLLLGLAPSTSYFIHFFTQSLSYFHITCPYHRNLFCCNTEIMLSIQSLSQPFTWNHIL